MGTKKRNHFKLNKTKSRCNYCTEIASSNNSIHVRCIREFLIKEGYILLRNPLLNQEEYL